MKLSKSYVRHRVAGTSYHITLEARTSSAKPYGDAESSRHLLYIPYSLPYFLLVTTNHVSSISFHPRALHCIRILTRVPFFPRLYGQSLFLLIKGANDAWGGKWTNASPAWFRELYSRDNIRDRHIISNREAAVSLSLSLSLVNRFTLHWFCHQIVRWLSELIDEDTWLSTVTVIPTS